MTFLGRHTNNKRKMKKLFWVVLSAIILMGCTGNKTEKINNKENYKAALADSVKAAERKIDSISNCLADLNEFVDSHINEFASVDNPREVEGYYILRNWVGKYPLSTNGLVARLTKSEQLELIATSRGVTFDLIEVVSGENSVKSAVVAHDQALNYRMEGLTTVMFSGEEAYSVANFIADNELNNIKLLYLENGKPRGSWQIPTDYKKMISSTFMLSASMRDLHKLELLRTKLHQKIDIMRKHME